VKKAIVILAGILVGLLVVGAIVLWYVDGEARKLAQSEAERRITERVPGAEGVHVTLDGFILLVDVALRSRVDGLHVHIDAIESRGLRVEGIRLDIEGIALDRERMLSDRTLVVTGIDRASLVAEIHDDVVTKATRHEVVFTPDTVTAEYQGRRVTANVAIRARKVELSVPIPGVAPLSFPLPDEDILPCEPKVEVLDGKLRLQCSVTELPAAVRKAMGG
jgi:hypothetical protein